MFSAPWIRTARKAFLGYAPSFGLEGVVFSSPLPALSLPKWRSFFPTPTGLKPEWKRKLVHCASGMFFICLFNYLPLSHAGSMAIAFVLSAIAITTESFRLASPRFKIWIWRYLGPIMREAEQRRINSAVFFTLTATLVYGVFPIQVANISILFLTFGDTAAGVIGTAFGRRKILPGSSLEGFLACLAVCAVASFLWASFALTPTLGSPPFLSLISFSLLSGLVGAVAESLPTPLDDNLVLPCFSAPFLWTLLKLFAIG